MNSYRTTIMIIIIAILFALAITGVVLGAVAVHDRVIVFSEAAPKLNSFLIEKLTFHYNTPKVVTVENKEDIEEFISILEPLIYKKEGFATDLMCSRIIVTFKSGEEIRITPRGYHIEINGNKYVVNADITELLFDFAEMVDEKIQSNRRTAFVNQTIFTI